MKSSVAVIGLVCVAGAFVLFNCASVASNEQKAEIAGSALPASLEDLYPPRSSAPTYLLNMYGLARTLSGTVGDVLEGDMENARSNFEAFKKAYTDNSALIPEWQAWYPIEPVERLGAAIASADPAKIMPAADEVGSVCHSCHLTYMAPVQHKFRWDDFAGIAVTDPLSGEQVSFARLMLMMSTNFDGIAGDLAQGQKENALSQFAGFSARFEAMANACTICHESERHYYVSEDISDLIAGLQGELSKPEVDMGIVGKLIQSIGQESCSKCHLVHIPAAYSQQATVKH